MTDTYSGYKKGELKHAGLSRSRLEELAVLHPDLAEEIKQILESKSYRKGGNVDKSLYRAQGNLRKV
jgi:hypothetical protein